MKTRFLRFGSFVASIALLFSLVPNASAKTQTKDTPYGKMTAIAMAGWYDEGHGPQLRARASTSIDSSMTMRKITTVCEAQYRDTGEQIWYHNFVDENVNETLLYDYQTYVPDPERGATVYTSHQVLYTEAYVIYMVNVVDDWDPDMYS